MNSLTAYLSDNIPVTLEAFSIPGTAVTVLRKGETLLCGGFGTRDAVSGIPADENTVFQIGSITKSFTASVLGTLVDGGKMTWDTPVRDILPSFRFENSCWSDTLTVRDVMSHRTGLCTYDELWLLTTYTQEEIFNRFRYLHSFAPPRTSFRYSNLMYMLGGMIAERLTGKPLSRLYEELIFTPLGMEHPSSTLEDYLKESNRSTAHALKEGEVRTIPYRTSKPMCAAGMINLTIRDLERWLRFNLSDGSSILSSDSLAMLRKPVTPIDPAEPLLHPVGKYRAMESLSYGMGWISGCYRGHRMVIHGGQIDGFCSMMALLPEIDSGVGVLTNLDAAQGHMALTLEIVDRLLELQPEPWTERLVKDTREAQDAKAQSQAGMVSLRREGAKPSHPLEDYCGTFSHPALGDITLRLDEGSLTGDMNSIPLKLEHFHYDIFIAGVDWPHPEVGIPLNFITSIPGTIDCIEFPEEELPEPVRFIRST